MEIDPLKAELSCTICYEIYTDPVTLICGHSYCKIVGDRVPWGRYPSV
uniref:Zinc finger RING-type eukaryotic domain-containing protein n=1 Tax=Leptobrachium leishanense TaxID=445787 RepID=A0A8C5MN71_9ANUR